MKRQGRPPKVDGGLKAVLYVRVEEQLLDQLDVLVEKLRKTGRKVSRADVVRDVLSAWLAKP